MVRIIQNVKNNQYPDTTNICRMLVLNAKIEIRNGSGFVAIRGGSKMIGSVLALILEK